MSCSSCALIRPVPSVSIYWNAVRSCCTSSSVAVLINRFIAAFLNVETPLKLLSLYRTSSLTWALEAEAGLFARFFCDSVSSG